MFVRATTSLVTAGLFTVTATVEVAVAPAAFLTVSLKFSVPAVVGVKLPFEQEKFEQLISGDHVNDVAPDNDAALASSVTGLLTITGFGVAVKLAVKTGATAFGVQLSGGVVTSGHGLSCPTIGVGETLGSGQGPIPFTSHAKSWKLSASGESPVPRFSGNTNAKSGAWY